MGHHQPNSRSSFTGEQPDPSKLLHLEVELSRPVSYSLYMTAYTLE